MIDLSYENTTFTTDDRLYAEMASDNHVNRYEFNLEEEAFEDFEPDELILDEHGGIPFYDDYLWPDKVEVLKPGTSRIDTTNLRPATWDTIKVGDVIVYTESVLNIVAEVEIIEVTPWGGKKALRSVDGFEINSDENDRILLGVR